MPKRNRKGKIITKLITNAFMEASFNDTDDDEATEEILENLEDRIVLTLTNPQLDEPTFPNILKDYNDKDFKELFRLRKSQFYSLLSLIYKNSLFKYPNARKYPTDFQLAITLYRLGATAERGTTQRVAKFFNVSEQSDVDVITQRIFSIILKLTSYYIRWPNGEERARIIASTYHELPNCIGYLDTDEIAVEGNTDMAEGINTLSIMLVIDYKLRIRHLEFTGQNGKISDYNELLEKSELTKLQHRMFCPEEWIAAGKPFALNTHIITPFQVNGNDKRRKVFNQRLNTYRSRAGCSLRLLKRRFRCLEKFKFNNANSDQYGQCCEWIIVCCIMHNILLTDADANACQLNPNYGLRYEFAGTDLDEDNEKSERKRESLCLVLTKARSVYKYTNI